MIARLGAALLLFATASASAEEGEFGSHWHDGKAEIDGYRLRVSRYGEVREGRAVAIFVTEPMSVSRRVKVEDASKAPEDTFDALKLNLVRDFQTGIYDYNTMVSVFVASGALSLPVKVSFTSAEWCGNVYQELLFPIPRLNGGMSPPPGVTGVTHSYFDGESGSISLEAPKDALVEDALFIQLRGLQGDFLNPGESRSSAYLPGTFFSRLSHRPPGWTKATIKRLAATETVDVPAGKFEAMVYELEVEGGRTGRFHVESAYPHRIVRWELPPDASAELTGTLRVPYWQLHGNGDERYLQDLGLE